MSDKNSREESHKIGAGALQAAGRTGLAEIRSVLYPGSGVPTDPGMYGVATQSEVVGQRESEPQSSLPERESVLDQRLSQAQKQAEVSRDPSDRNRPSFEKE